MTIQKMPAKSVHVTYAREGSPTEAGYQAYSVAVHVDRRTADEVLGLGNKSTTLRAEDGTDWPLTWGGVVLPANRARPQDVFTGGIAVRADQAKLPKESVRILNDANSMRASAAAELPLLWDIGAGY